MAAAVIFSNVLRFSFLDFRFLKFFYLDLVLSFSYLLWDSAPRWSSKAHETSFICKWYNKTSGAAELLCKCSYIFLKAILESDHTLMLFHLLLLWTYHILFKINLENWSSILHALLFTRSSTSTCTCNHWATMPDYNYYTTLTLRLFNYFIARGITMIALTCQHLL